jgi:hypothetical protein
MWKAMAGMPMFLIQLDDQRRDHPPLRVQGTQRRRLGASGLSFRDAKSSRGNRGISKSRNRGGPCEQDMTETLTRPERRFFEWLEAVDTGQTARQELARVFEALGRISDPDERSSARRRLFEALLDVSLPGQGFVDSDDAV